MAMVLRTERQGLAESEKAAQLLGPLYETPRTRTDRQRRVAVVRGRRYRLEHGGQSERFIVGRD